MPTVLSEADAAKFAAARRSVDFVEDGMRVGLGTGSTAVWMVRALAARARRDGLRLDCVPTSEATGRLASSLGLKVVTLDEAGWLDLTIDGADEFDPAFNLIKGGGGAHLREKIVAAASDRMVVIADPGKEVATLGAYPLPIEVVPFGLESSLRHIERVLADADVDGRKLVLRGGGTPFVTDEGNRTIDAHLIRIGDPAALSDALNRIPGVVENGLFLGISDTVIIGHADGRAETRQPSGAATTRVDLAEAGLLIGDPA